MMPDFMMEDFYDQHFANLARSYPEADLRQMADFIVQALGLKAGERVLDIGCGLGRLSLILAQQGFTVTGVDACKAYIQEAQAKADSAQNIRQNIEFIQADARSLLPNKPYDAAFFWHTSFGHFNQDADNLALLRSAFSQLRPSGRLLLDYPNFYQTISRFEAEFKQHYSLPEGPLTVIRHSQLEPEAGLLKQNWEFCYANGERATRQGKLKIYLPDRLISLLDAAGFDLLSSYGSSQAKPFHLNQSRWIGVLQRRAT